MAARERSASPEFKIVCACCAEGPDNGRLLELLRQPVNWQDLTKTAEHHGLIPRVYDRLRIAPHVPREALAAIQGLYQSNLKRSLWFTRELGRILSHFAKLDIPALPFKGPVLAESLHGDIAARHFSDLDILVHDYDVSRIKHALQELGFRPQLELPDRQERSYLRSGYELIFDSGSTRNVLEIQWQILPRFYAVDFDVNSLFQRATARTVAGIPLRSLSDEDSLLVLCVHAGKHAWIQLSWLCDVTRSARQETLNWNFILSEAERLGVQRIVAVTFLLAQKLLGNPLPEKLRIDADAKLLADQIVPLIESNRHFDTESLGYFQLTARTRERLQDRCRFWWRLATTPSIGEWNAVQLPSSLFPLYRFVRPFRAAMRFLPFR